MKIVPALCERDFTSGRVLDDPAFIFELKLDGVRIVAEKIGAKVTLTYRKIRDATKSYPEIVDAVGALGEKRLVRKFEDQRPVYRSEVQRLGVQRI